MGHTHRGQLKCGTQATLQYMHAMVYGISYHYMPCDLYVQCLAGAICLCLVVRMVEILCTLQPMLAFRECFPCCSSRSITLCKEVLRSHQPHLPNMRAMHRAYDMMCRVSIPLSDGFHHHLPWSSGMQSKHCLHSKSSKYTLPTQQFIMLSQSALVYAEGCCLHLHAMPCYAITHALLPRDVVSAAPPIIVGLSQ